MSLVAHSVVHCRVTLMPRLGAPVVFALALFTAAALVAGPKMVKVSAATTDSDYQTFSQQMVTVDNLADCISKMDELVDISERPVMSGDDAPRWIGADTKNGFHLAYCVAKADEAVIYDFAISRNGQEFGFSDAAKIIALFGDRVGLPHPIIMTAGENSSIHGRWLIKPKEWKSLKKKMMKVRAENRAEKNPVRSFEIAVLRELDAREAAQRKKD